MSALNLSNLTFSWPRAARPTLDIGSLALEPGESLFLYGPSGSGKSTLLSAIAGVVAVPPGAIRIGETDVGALRGSARDRFRADHLGVIFQVFNLVPWLSARDNVLLATRFSKRRSERAGPRPELAAIRLLSELGLIDPAVINAPASALSVGQQQRVAAARALIGGPDLILADEPTSALDDEAKVAFVDLLAHECVDTGAALLFVSHDRSLEGRFDRAVSFTDLNHKATVAC